MGNNNIFCFFVICFSYIIGGVFYVIHGFNFVDEILVLIILSYYIIYAFIQRKVDKNIKTISLFLLFYLLYSLAIGVTNKMAVFRDLLQESKPLISFFVIYALNPSFNQIMKQTLMIMSLVFGGLSFILFVIGGDLFFGHNAFYGHIMLMSSLIYLFASTRNKMDLLVFFFLLSLGLLCTRSKYYGEFALALILMFVVKMPIKIGFKSLLGGLSTICIVILAAWEKFNAYFVEGLDNDSIARNLLYIKSLDVLKDFFPFGSGFGTYGVDATKVYYSPLYYKYGLSNIWGLSENYDSFIADTYFPVIIAQFGLLGIFLFYKFLKLIVNKAGEGYLPHDNILYASVILIISSILIESVAGPMFVMSSGSTILILLACCLREMEIKKMKVLNSRMLYLILLWRGGVRNSNVKVVKKQKIVQ